MTSVVTRLPRTPRLLVAVGSVLLLSVFVFPLWSIHLTAPQYPEGLGMFIRVNTIVGASEFDLAKINNLNHYIGMRPIVPGEVPELQWMPWLFAALAAAGFTVAALGRRRGLYAWLIAFALVGIAGLVDFYRWGYDYGHNLDAENAIIKIPGMSYQPPLIGTKQLLNFTATSWPALGGWLAFLALVLGVIAAFIAVRAHRRAARGTRMAAVAVMAAACVGPGASVAPHDRAGHHAATTREHLVHETPRPDRDGNGSGVELVSVSPDGPVRSLAEAMRVARPGGRIIVRPGIYREPTIVVNKPITIVGERGAVLDGEGSREIMTIVANDVTVRGMGFRDVGGSVVRDNAAIKVIEATRCAIEGNRIDNGFFGIYLADVSECRIAGNVLEGNARSEATSGNGIHLWSARDVTVEDNQISGHRDGIYFEFVRNTVVQRNVSERNLRYGLHFMYSDDCRYAKNAFLSNRGGVAVMYTKRIEMVENRFEDNWGSAAYGLLLKEIYDPVIERNRFHRNTTGVVADGAVRIVASGNDFLENGWALKLLGSTYDGRVERNNFIGNTFDVTANGSGGAMLAGNYFDSYRGYDLDRDGIGDVPHHPVRLFSVIVERNPPSIILLRTIFVDLLDVAERVLPALTPAALVDDRPAALRQEVTPS